MRYTILFPILLAGCVLAGGVDGKPFESWARTTWGPSVGTGRATRPSAGRGAKARFTGGAGVSSADFSDGGC